MYENKINLKFKVSISTILNENREWFVPSGQEMAVCFVEGTNFRES